ncbi:MAG: response regulator [Magnetococcales bacterium]|nr:response regulator [Magnetococcales bacterium]
MKSPPRTLLIVDDAPENLTILGELLRPEFRVRATRSGKNVLRIATSDPRPDLILLDVMMPDLNGFQVFELLRASPATQAIPVMFITAMGGIEAELRGFEVGAVDYITKPFVPAIVLARVRTQLELKQARDILKDQNAWLEAEVNRRMRDNELIQTVAIRALAHLAETRDPETGNHILRTQGYVQELALGLRDHARFRATLHDRYIDMLTRSAPLHDIGKVGIPDAILRKPGPLDGVEWAIMQTHARLGAEAIELAERDAEQPVEFLTLAKEIARWHHERWDGSGYPDHRAGEAIPVSARLMAVADVFDALTSRRVYKAPLTHDQARTLIVQGSGTQFDPDVVEVFQGCFESFCTISDCHHDPQGQG